MKMALKKATILMTEAEYKHTKKCIKDLTFTTRKRLPERRAVDFQRYLLEWFCGARDRLALRYGLHHGEKNKEINPVVAGWLDELQDLIDRFGGKYHEVFSKLENSDEEIAAFFEEDENRAVYLKFAKVFRFEECEKRGHVNGS